MRINPRPNRGKALPVASTVPHYVCFWASYKVRCAERLLMTISMVMSFHERPCARRAATWAASTATGGLPRPFPLARAFRRSSFTRSECAQDHRMASEMPASPYSLEIVQPAVRSTHHAAVCILFGLLWPFQQIRSLRVAPVTLWGAAAGWDYSGYSAGVGSRRKRLNLRSPSLIGDSR
jgi:hypothetical protein